MFPALPHSIIPNCTPISASLWAHLKDCLPTFSLAFLEGWLLCVLLNKQEHAWETGWVINEIASNNQLLLNLLTVLSTLLLVYVHDALGTCLWVTCWMRGKNGGLRAVVLAESLEWSYIIRETMFDKKQTVQQSAMSACCPAAFVWCGGVVRWRSGG